MGIGNPHNYPWFSNQPLNRYVYDVKRGRGFREDIPEFEIAIAAVDHAHADELAAKIGLALNIMLLTRN